MKVLSMIFAAGCLAVAAPAMVSTASADVVTKTVTTHHGYHGHGCRTVRTVRRGPGGKQVTVRRVCR